MSFCNHKIKSTRIDDTHQVTITAYDDLVAKRPYILVIEVEGIDPDDQNALSYRLSIPHTMESNRDQIFNRWTPKHAFGYFSAIKDLMY